MSTFYL